jgi:hypothetical protein
MKRILLTVAACVAFIGYIENPAHACTASQTARYNLAVRLQHTAVDISKNAAGDRADAAVNALLDLVEAIDRTLPKTCGARS